MKLTTFNDFEKIVVEEIPLIDVRAPIEYQKGAFINAVNLPLMNDEERHLVGICYKEKGNEEAVKLGHQLVAGAIKEARIVAWKTQLEQFPSSMIYCFRGGLRSQISQQWITEVTGTEIERLEGGYKAFRNYLLEALEPEHLKSKPVIIGGCTGAGKTLLLKKLDNAIDLERLANHKGSSFGKQITPQPTQIDFENNLAYALIQHKHKGYGHMIIEDEGSNVGKCLIPKPLAAYFGSGDLILMEVPFEERVQITLQEYVKEAQTNYEKAYGKEQGVVEWGNQIKTSLYKIKNRLGGDRYKCAISLFEQACKEQIQSLLCDQHKSWIEMLLREYYDPMYQYQIKKTTKKIIFKGNSDEVLAYVTKSLHS